MSAPAERAPEAELPNAPAERAPEAELPNAANVLRDCVFTLNNPPDESEWPILSFARVSYLTYQYEIAPTTGTRHVQGYVEFSSGVRFAQLRALLLNAHIEKRRGSPSEAAAYCQKAETREPGSEYYERGTRRRDPKRGSRSDLIELRAAIDGGQPLSEIYSLFPEACAKYPGYITKCFEFANDAKRPRITEYAPRYAWQTRILELIKEEPDTRSIYWIYDAFGNAGKTYLARHLVDMHNAFYTGGGKASDIVHAYLYQPIVIFDYVRDSQEFVGYGVIEQLKNGVLFSPKYQSATKCFKPPHVIVFANFAPASGKFSLDRVTLIELASTHEERA